MSYTFLNEISRVSEMYTRHRKLSGEDFNIFSIMSMESDEVFTHSALLAELLHPKGTHGMGTKPLELFVQKFLDADYKMNFENAVCRKEDHIGFTDADKTKGGRIDIVVKDLEGNVILIENKIYAAEQLNQLKRYKKQFPNAELFYLTLDGKESGQITVGDDESKIYRNLSYRDDIIPWISKCTELAHNKPMLREVLNQYTFLLKKLTNQTTNIEMAEQISKIITDNFEASLEIYRNFEKVSKELKHNLLTDLAAELKLKYPSLNVTVSEYKTVPAIHITGFAKSASLYFRFKSDKMPVITLEGIASLTQDLSKLSFKEHRVDQKVLNAWKMLPVLTEEKLFADKLAQTRLDFNKDVSDVIDQLI